MSAVVKMKRRGVATERQGEERVGKRRHTHRCTRGAARLGSGGTGGVKKRGVRQEKRRRRRAMHLSSSSGGDVVCLFCFAEREIERERRWQAARSKKGSATIIRSTD